MKPKNGNFVYLLASARWKCASLYLVHITEVVWTDVACNILYENASVGICNFWSRGIRFVYII